MDRDAMIDAIRMQAVNDAAREMMRDGIVLSWDEADDVGDEGVDWLRNRLGLTISSEDDGVHCMPAEARGT